MTRHSVIPRKLLIVFSVFAVATGPLGAVTPPEHAAPVADRQFRHPDLDIRNAHLRPGTLPSAALDQALQDLAELGVRESAAYLDWRGGGWATLLPSRPLVPGDGLGNTLSRGEREETTARFDRSAFEDAVRQSFHDFLETHQEALRIDTAELTAEGTVTVHGRGELVQIHLPREIDGVPVRGSYVSAVVNHGNLVLLGAARWGRFFGSTRAELTPEDAVTAAREYLAIEIRGWSRPRLVLLPMARGRDPERVAVGEGYDYRLVWVLRTEIPGELGDWEALVDARSGEVLAFEDVAHYADVKGGVLPVSNDGIAPDGVEQSSWPMPFAHVSTAAGQLTSDSGGNLPGASGTLTADLSGPYARMNDSCGPISLSATGGLDFGINGGTDCTTPGIGGAGNTRASRTGFYELNRMAELARSHLPSNTWLQSRLTAGMNLTTGTCNACWNCPGHPGEVIFFRSGGGCANTGELAAVIDHEWGHGMDANDATPGVSYPGEGIADLYAALRLYDSCIGRGFKPGVLCDGFGDPCTSCTGIRDIDYLKRQTGTPHTFTWANDKCNHSVHCLGGVYAEAVWSLWRRDLAAAPYNMDVHTAAELVTRLTFLGSGGVGTWFSGSPPQGGCAATNGYLNYLAADDDNGNLNDGTPHMTAIYNAFHRQEIACDVPAVVDSGCPNTPDTAPVLTATPLDKSVSLNWSVVGNTTKYQIFRTDGVSGCDFGKVKVGESTTTSFQDSGLQNGREYSYVVFPIGVSETCMGPASNCTTLAPVDLNLDLDLGSAVVSPLSGDGDEFLDNCETARVTFDVTNNGTGPLTNVRVASVVSTSHPSITYQTTFPVPVSPSFLSQGAVGLGSFVIAAAGLAFQDTVTFQVEITADELSGPRTGTLTLGAVESDFQAFASKTFDFETGTEGWEVVEGTFSRSATGGGQGTLWFEGSSGNLENQCDHIRSPILQLTASSTLTLYSRHDIEPLYVNGFWYDRANLGIYQVASGLRTPVHPDGGRLYSANGPGGTCGTNAQAGWAGSGLAWGPSTWSAAALGAAGFAGQKVQLDLRYGTDNVLSGFGFHFDQVTVTDASFLAADGQADSCGCLVDADCDNGVFCDGAERCDEILGCQPGNLPCAFGQTCNEAADICEGGTFCLHEADFEAGAPGWFTGAGTTCTSGFFALGTPDPEVDGGVLTQVGGGAGGSAIALFTQPNPFGPSDYDVDGGTCEVMSPAIDASGQAAVEISLDYFHGQRDGGDDGTDSFTVEVLSNGVVVDTLVGISDVAHSAVWTAASTTVHSPGLLQLRVRATDGVIDSDLLEAGIDNVRMCPTSPQPPCTVEDNFDVAAAGWYIDPLSNCTAGQFVLDTPTLQFDGGVVTQVGGDHTSGVGKAIFTSPNFSADFDDVDGGNCILRSPAWYVDKASQLSLWFFHGQRTTGDDVWGDYFLLEYSIDNGVTWTPMAWNGDFASNAAWTQAVAPVPAGSVVQVRVQASDGAFWSDILEAGIDDLAICPNLVFGASFDAGGFAEWSAAVGF